MKKNTYFLLGLFLCLLIAAYLVLQKPGEQSASSAGIGPLFTVDSSLVDKIEIKSSASSLVLEKRGAEWFVNQPVSDKADQANVGQIIHQIKNLEVKNSVSSKPEKHSVFQVDQTGTQVTLWEKGVEKAAFILGKMAESYTASFVRKLHSDEVFLVEGASGYMFNRPLKEWRDKTISTVPKESIKEVRYQYGDTTFSVSLVDSLWVVGKEKAQPSVVDGILSVLSNIQADDFIDTAITPKITAQLTYAGTQLRFSFIKDQNRFEVQSSNSPRWYVLESWKANQLLKRKKEIVVP
ncbi:MAG: DUF4340 domain-containing protein [Ignavibacteriae bacterium]|nr:MAG: DUF4340 domain-containing protein [Ignavibacteriota bacterium]